MSNRPIDDLEYNKFEPLDSNNPAVRIVNSGLLNVQYDYVSVAYPSGVSEVYTFKINGSGGTTVRVITLVYTDSTKDSLSSAERTS